MKANIPTHHEIKRALQIYEEIEGLQNELANLFGVKSAEKVAAILSRAGSFSDVPAKRRGRPPKAIVIAKRGRKKADKATETSSAANDGEALTVKRRGRPPGSGVKAKKAKRTISPEHREAIAAAQKRRWAAARGE